MIVKFSQRYSYCHTYKVINIDIIKCMYVYLLKY